VKVKSETLVEVYGEGGDTGLRCSRIRYTQPVEIHINGQVVYSNFRGVKQTE
jgi:hypothetical protein